VEQPASKAAVTATVHLVIVRTAVPAYCFGCN